MFEVQITDLGVNLWDKFRTGLDLLRKDITGAGSKGPYWYALDV